MAASESVGPENVDKDLGIGEIVAEVCPEVCATAVVEEENRSYAVVPAVV